MIRITTDKDIEAIRAKATEEERRRAYVDERFMNLSCRIDALEEKIGRRIFEIEDRLNLRAVPVNLSIAPNSPGWKQPCTTTTEQPSFSQVITPEGEPK